MLLQSMGGAKQQCSNLGVELCILLWLSALEIMVADACAF